MHTTAGYEDRLDEVIAAYLRGGSGRDELIAAHPDLAGELRSFFKDQDMLGRMAAPIRAAMPARWPDSIGPYQILGEIARGGMGVVLRARHTHLGRPAAIKLLLAGKHASADDLARFRREAHAAASLDHPNIVPLHEVGEHDGLPYLVMKQMAGSLADALNRGEFKPCPAAARRAASLVALVARAVHHAHSRGVLHRDLKPANVLLDADGSPAVSDFGLARRADAPGSTASGAMLGTPAYMSPEQAAGRTREVSVLSDVYGLGAILYELLTGRPPFTGGSAIEVLRKVLDEEPAPPRSFAPAVGAALETIVRKCLDKTPSRRYASALALAEDLERWLAGEPILARPAGPLERAWRWARRHPTVALLSALLLTVVAAGVALVTHEWLRAEGALDLVKKERDAAKAALAQAGVARAAADESARQAKKERDAANKARAESDESFKQAHQAANDFLVAFSKEIARMPGTHALRQQLLRLARANLEEFIRRRAGDPRLRRELADTHVSLAQLTGGTGDRRAALGSYREALAIYRALHADAPSDLVVRRKLAATLVNLATVQDTAPGIETRREALEVYRHFLAEAPDDPDLVSGLAMTVGNQGSALMSCGKIDEAEAMIVEAIQRQTDLAERTPGSALYWKEMTGSLHNYAVLLSRRGDRLGALWAHQRCAAYRYWLVTLFPDDHGMRCALAATYHSIGLSLQHLGQSAEGNVGLDAALDLRQKLAAENPLVVRYQADFAASLSSRGVARNATGRRDEGLKYFHQARQILQAQADADRSDLGLRHQLGEMWFNIGATHGALKQRVQEGDAFEKALAVQQPLVDADPENAEFRHGLSRTLNNLGLNYGVRRRDDAAVPILERAVASTALLLKRTPGSAANKQLMNSHLGLLALSLGRLGKREASLDATARRAALWPDDAEQQFRAAREAARLLPADDEALGRRIESRALEFLRRAIKCGFTDKARLRGTPEFAPLRGLPDFESLFPV